MSRPDPREEWGWLKAVYRERKRETNDDSVAMFAMVKAASQTACPSQVVGIMTEDLRRSGEISENA